MLQRCSDLHITLSKSKFQISNSLKFAGCIVSDKGVQPDPDRVSSLTNFPTPSDQTGVRSFLGLCNQLAFFIPDYQHHTVSLRQLTGKGRPFLWLPEHQHEFDTLKRILSSSSVILTHRKTSSSSPMLPACMAWVMPLVTLMLILRGQSISKLFIAGPRV